MADPASATFPWSALPEPAAGEKRSQAVHWTSPDLTLPCVAVRGSQSGPAVLILTTLEGASYPAVHGLLRFVGALDGHRLHGSLLALPWIGRPDLAQAFSGAPATSSSRQMVARIVSDVLEPAGALVELAGDLARERWLPSAVSFDGTGSPSANLARAAGLEHAISYPAPSHATSPTGWAAIRGLPACRVIVPDDLELRTALVERVMVGLANQLRVLGALEGLPLEVETRTSQLVGVAAAPVDGLWTPAVELGQRVNVDDRLGELRRETGEIIGHLRATQAGEVVAITTAVRVEPSEPLVRFVDSG